MEGEQRHYELRSGSRSRSRTPLVQTRALVEPEIVDHQYDLRIRSVEGSHTPGDAVFHKRAGSSSKTYDQNMESMGGIKEEVVITSSEDENKKAENSFTVTKKMERQSERQKAKKHVFANGQTEKKNNSVGRNTQKGSRNASSRKILTSDYSSEEGEREDSLTRPSSAHEIYKQAGDWWNVFPKTDYTYSARSQCRYEIAPGILAMPNMSRRSIHSNPEESNTSSLGPFKSSVYEAEDIGTGSRTKSESRMVTGKFNESHISNSDEASKVQYAKAHVEQHSCHREIMYSMPHVIQANSGSRQRLISDTPLKRITPRKYNIASVVDSDAELQEAVSSSRNNNEHRKLIQYFMSFPSILTLWFYKLLEFLKLKTIKRRGYRATFECQGYGQEGFRIWRHLDRLLQYVYLFMVKVFVFDTWLLSRAVAIRRWMDQRCSKVLWVAILPLLLLAGCWCFPYLSSLFLSTKVNARQFKESPMPTVRNNQLAVNGEMFGKADDFGAIIDMLNNRINNLEDRTIEHYDRLSNVSIVLEQLSGKKYVWSEDNNGVSFLDRGQMRSKSADSCTQEIEITKSQLERLKEMYAEQKLCCNTHMDYVTRDDLEKRIQMILAGYIDALASKTKDIEVEGKSSGISGNAVVTDDRVREIVKEALRIYDADKTGRADYALETAGGQVISTRCTQRYDIKTRALKIMTFTLYHENDNPRTVIQGNPIQPGACWAFQGFPGYLLIKLRSSIYVTGFTVEHAPKAILPNGEMKSAPKKFNVWGFVDENDPEPVMFGDYEFAASHDNLQYFPVQNAMIKTPYEYVELRVHSNHGQLEYTCLYRFRVHGKPA